MTTNVHTWWLVLCAVAAFNVAAWSWSARKHGSHRLQLLLSAGYVFGCAYRSVFPVYDIPRLTLFDTPLASAFVGRTVASIAELCFAVQWALMLHESARATGSRTARRTALQIVPLIVVAEVCSWYSVLSTSNLGHVVEESLWALCAALLAASLASFWSRSTPAQRPLLALWCAAALAYLAYMLLVDVPTYWSRWVADEAQGRQYLGLAQGALDAAGRWVVSTRWEDWQGEVTWMTLYFSVGVWLSIGLIHVPVLKGRAGPVTAARGRERPAAARATAR